MSDITIRTTEPCNICGEVGHEARIISGFRIVVCPHAEPEKIMAFSPTYTSKELRDDALRRLHAAMMADNAAIARQFPDKPGNDEVEATEAWRKSASLLKKSVSRDFYHEAVMRMFHGPHGPETIPQFCARVGDWQLLLFAAKLIRYLALSVRYEQRIFTAEQRSARDERAKRHAKLLQKWPVQSHSLGD